MSNKNDLIAAANERIKYQKTAADYIGMAMAKLTSVEDKYTKNGEFQEKGCNYLAAVLEEIKALYRKHPNSKQAREMRQVLKDYNWLKE